VKYLGDNFARMEPYITVLEQLGIEVLAGPWYMNHWREWIIDNADSIDFVYMNRPHISIKYVDFIKRYTSAKIIYYVVDLHFLREFRRYEIEGKKDILAESNRWKEIEFNIINKVDVVFTISELEKDIIQKNFPDKAVEVIPVFIYDRFDAEREDFRSKQDILYVGAFHHTPSLDGILWFCRDIFPKIARRIPDLKLYVVGANPTKEVMALNSSNIIVKGFVSDEELRKFYKKVKVVVIPLRYGAGVKGKTIEAMYYGAPIVSTAIGTEGLKDIESLIHPYDTPEDFADEVVNLYQNEDRLQSMSISFKNYVRRNISKERAIEIVKSSFSKSEEQAVVK
jgi:glycosyltransferase involved in cell wall biosynthesis